MTEISIPDQRNFWRDFYNSGSGQVSPQIQNYFQLFAKHQSNSVLQDRFYSTRFVDAILQITQIYEECREENWDGYGSLAISPAVFFEAIRFIFALPQGLPSPEIVPEPAGDIGFEWNFGKNRVFVASVSGTNYITYAGLFGIGVKTHGSEVFNDSIPKILIEHISRISQVS